MPHRSRQPRLTGIFLMLLVVASSFTFVPPAAAVGRDALTFGPDGELSATFGANAIVAIDGAITFEDNCPEGGIDDWVFPATDVYIVAGGSVGTGSELADVGGGRPNTIVSNATIFMEEVIGFTQPTGKLGTGTYDVVYDTCQDGTFDPAFDTLFPGAIEVALPTVLPPASAAITRMKGDAFVEYATWLASRIAMQQFFKLADRALKVQCQTGNAIGCAMKKLDYFDGIKEKFLTLMLSQANHYLAIAMDPPDPDFDRVTTVRPIADPADHSDSPIATATAAMLLPAATESAISEALLHAVERYQGSVAAGDAAWALEHAREAQRLAGLLATAAVATSDAVRDLRDALSADTELGQALTQATQFAAHVWSSGFSAAERRALLNAGLSTTEIVGLESDVRSAYGGGATDLAGLLDALDETVAAHGKTADSAAAAADDWAGVVASIEADPAIVAAGPGADAGGPYAAGEGEPLTLHGSSPTPAVAAAWDLDADGDFDDATGLEPTTSFPTAGVHLVGLRVTAGERVSVAYGLVAIGDSARAPVISDPVPAVRSATVIAGASQLFSIIAVDPDGDPGTFAWALDGDPLPGSGPSFSFAPTLADVGVHRLTVVVSDGTAGGATTRRTWDVIVLAPDEDGDGWTSTVDCDDDDVVVHPAALERFGNGIDDDCDPGTPDAPPGGLVGSMWSWGSNHNGSVGSGSFSPTLMASPFLIPDHADIVQVDSSSGGGFAVTADGRVYGWGFNGSGELGIGTFAGSATPVSPLPVGGGSGFLAGVTQISAHSHIAARRADGTVVSWGSNSAGQVGDGSGANSRLYPVVVLSGAGGPPLSGVRSVETGYVETYAIMDDGTVRAWGQIRCDGGTGIRQEPYPVELDLVGGGVKQVSSGNQWTMFLKDDGTILSCGTLAPTAGRPVSSVTDAYLPKPIPGFGPGSPAIDISAGIEGGMALKADGSVWMWGYNANGSLSAIGAPGGTSVPSPVQVPLPPGPPVVDIDMDTACHALALRADGSVLTWGCDFFEQAGDGPSTGDWIVETPTVISMPGHSAVSVTNAVWNSLVLARPIDDDTTWERPATWVTASVADATVGESAGGTFTVSLSAALPHDVEVQWSLLAGTAGPGDLEFAGGTVTIPAGATSVDVAVPVLDDALDEDDETFTFVLSDVSHGIRLARAQANGTVVDDDAAPTIGITSVVVDEGDTAITDVVVRLSLSAPSSKPISVAYATADGSATAPGDFAAAAGPVVIAPGALGIDLHLSVRGDTAVEPEEQLAINLSDPQNAVLGDAQGEVTIRDDEPLVVDVTSPQVAEGDSGTTPATFTVTLSPAAPTGTFVSVGYSVEGLSAGVPDDVAAATGTLEFAAGDGPKQIVVDVVGDVNVEGPEVFRLALGAPVASDGRTVLAGDNPPAVILDDDVETVPPANVPPVVDAGADTGGQEGAAIALDGGASDPDAGDTLTAAWTYQAGSDVDQGATCLFADAAAVDASITCTDDGTFTATLAVSDGNGHTTTDQVTIVVTNAAPSVVITTSSGGVTVATGATVLLSATITDPGAGDVHTCTIDWGDGTVTAGSVMSGTCTGSHAYAAPAAPIVTVSVADDDAGTGDDEVALLVTSDSTKVSGGGWIEPGGVRTSFGFVVGPAPAGFDGELQVNSHGHRFHGHEVAALSVSRPSATWSGSGRWDGAEGFTFTVTVQDLRNGGDRKGSPDTVSIEIRDAAGTVVFAASGPLVGGNVKVR